MKKAQHAVGMMIIFITVVIIALMFVDFFTRESYGFGRTGYAAGRAGMAGAKSGVAIEAVTVQANSDSEIDALIMTMEPIIGSEPMGLDDFIVIIRQRNTTSYLLLRNGTSERNATHGYYTG